jgi:hypothetical protein
MGALFSYIAHAKQFQVDETNRKIAKNLEDWNKNLVDWLLFIQKLDTEQLENWKETCDAFQDKANKINDEITGLRTQIKNIRSVI